MILSPLAQAAIFALVLSEVLAAKLPGIANKSAYAIYLMSGMAAWGLFTEILNRSLTVFIEYANTLKKIAFPRLCLPVIVGGSAVLNHFLLLLATIVIFALFGHLPGLAWLALPLVTLIIVLFAFGLGIILGLLNVFSRDVAQVMGIVIQLWFWFTPVVYLLESVPARFASLLKLNPMTNLVHAYQQILLYKSLPDLSTLVAPAVLALLLFIFAFWLFRRASADLVDAL